MGAFLASLFLSMAALAANQFKEVICWNSGGAQVLKVNAQRVRVEDEKTEIYLKSSNAEADYVVIGGTCLVKKL